MLTEEKLQKFIDDLRLGKYDAERYEIKQDSVTDLQTKTTIRIHYREYSQKLISKKSLFGKNKLVTAKLEKPIFEISINYEFIAVSKELYYSYKTYFDEIQQKEDLVQRLNIQESFGL